MTTKMFVLTIVTMILVTTLIITLTLTDHVDVLRGAGLGVLYLAIVGGIFGVFWRLM